MGDPSAPVELASSAGMDTGTADRHRRAGTLKGNEITQDDSGQKATCDRKM